MNKNITLIVMAGLVVSGALYGSYWIGTRHASAPPAALGSSSATNQASGSGEKKVLYWHDPMVPVQKFDKPGKSPFMDMQLVPVYAGDAADEGKVSVSPRMQQNLGVRTAIATTGALSTEFSAVGSVAYNERDVALVQARGTGYLERLLVRAPLDPVRKGQPLAELYVPDWVAVQEEYFAVKRMGHAAADLLPAARQRMRLAGMTEDQIRDIERSGKPSARTLIRAPIDGVIGELAAREGMAVSTGAALFKINSLARVWVIAEIPEAMAGPMRPAVSVEVRAHALPGEVFQGKLGLVLPELNAATRTLRARVELPNPGARLLPGMFATITFKTAGRAGIVLVPSEAVIQTGTRSVVMVVQAPGKFAPVEVEIGSEGSGQTEIRRGLTSGQEVVVSGQFLLDSEANLKAATARMGEMPSAPGAARPVAAHRGDGKVEKIESDEITLSHGPIPSLKWGAMTMGFKLPPGGLPTRLAVGDTVSFSVRELDDGVYQVVTIERRTGGTK